VKQSRWQTEWIKWDGHTHPDIKKESLTVTKKVCCMRNTKKVLKHYITLLRYIITLL
jgi:hypothetical protein